MSLFLDMAEVEQHVAPQAALNECARSRELMARARDGDGRCAFYSRAHEDRSLHQCTRDPPLSPQAL